MDTAATVTEDQAEQHAAKLAELRKNARRCPLCGTWIQRTPAGTLADGMTAHRQVVHGIH